MSARSPRGSLSGASDVASDFEDSLKDLHQNNRYEISNLTLIAKESTEHAQSISKALENHIRTAPPNRKLPALYVLDSIVKNVGTPYTVYLGRNLYSTFMEAYLLVDATTRRNMEGMLKTWKESVPGSMDPRPVFPPETVRPIETALIKARTAALQNRSQVQPQPGLRNTPTPPQYISQTAPPPEKGLPQSTYYGYGSQQPTPQPQPVQPFATPTPNLLQQYAPSFPQSQQSQELQTLKYEIQALIEAFKAHFAASPHDQELRAKLESLLALNNYVDANPDQMHHAALQQVKTAVTNLAVTLAQSQRPTPPPKPSASQPMWKAPPTPVQPHNQPYRSVQPQPVTLPYVQPTPPQAHPQPAPPSNALPINPGTLKSLQALFANGRPSTPNTNPALANFQPSHPIQANGFPNSSVNVPQSTNPTNLLAALASSGVLSRPPVPNASQATPIAASAVLPASSSNPVSGLNASAAELLKSLSSVLPTAINSHPSTPSLPIVQVATPTNAAAIPPAPSSLKTFRPYLVQGIYTAQPNQCGTCGRRFPASDDGRARKARHLDWHFRTNQRVADPALNRGSHRNWFVDELTWIRTVEFDVSTATAEESAAAAAVGGSRVGEAGAGAGVGAGATSDRDFARTARIRAPPGVTSVKCSICYEEIRSSYDEELRDWVFPGARKWAGKIVHAACADAIQRASAAGALGQRSRSATPESSSLGKRKADTALVGSGPARVKVE